METSDGSRSVVLRVWQHGNTTVARLLVARDRLDVVAVRCTGRDEILAWLDAWLDDGAEPSSGRDGAVTDS